MSAGISVFSEEIVQLSVLMQVGVSNHFPTCSSQTEDLPRVLEAILGWSPNPA